MNPNTHKIFKQLVADSDEATFWTERGQELFDEYPNYHPEKALAKTNTALAIELQQFCEENPDYYLVLENIHWNWIAQQILRNAIDMEMALLEWSTK